MAENNSDIKKIFDKIDNTSFEELLDLRKKSKEFIQKYINVGDELVRDFLEMKTSDEFKIPLAIH